MTLEPMASKQDHYFKEILMTLDDIKGLSQDEQFQKAAEFAGVPASVFRGMWKTESSEGKAMLSPAGARGHFGIMPATQHTWEKRTGQKLDPNNFVEGLTLAALTLKENMSATKGNIPNALRMYNGGTDRSKWGNAETAAYARKVLGVGDMDTSEYDIRDESFVAPSPEMVWNTSAYDLAGLHNAEQSGASTKEYLSDVEKGVINQAGVEAATAAVVGGVDPVAAALETRAAAHEDSQATVNTVVDSLSTRPVGEEQDVEGFAEVGAVSDLQEAQATKDEAVGFGDKLWAAARNDTGLFAILDYMDKQSGVTSKYDPNFKYLDNIDKIEEGRTEDEIDELSNVNSMGEAMLLRKDQDEERARNETISTNSSGAAVLGYHLLAGAVDPVGWVAGFGVGKAAQVVGLGSRAAFAAGNVGKGFLAAGGEGMAGNLLFTATLDAMGKHQSTGDYAMSAASGLLIGGGLGALEWRGSARDVARKEFADMAEQMNNSAAEYNKSLYEKAAAEAGPSATPEDVARIATRIDGEQQQALQRVVLGDVPDSDRLFPRLDVNEKPPEPVVIDNEFIATTKAGTFKLVDTEAVNTEQFSEFGQLRTVTAHDGDKVIGKLDYANDGTPPTIEVNPAYRRMGVGTAMLKLAQERGGKLGTAEGGMNGAGANYRTPDGIAFRTAADEASVTLAPRTKKSNGILPNALLNTAAKRKAAIKKYGLDVSLNDDSERIMVAEIFARSEQFLGENPIDKTRLTPLLSKVGWEATSTRMLLSDSPVMRATAALLLENPEGAAGRKITGAMTKAMRERVYVGNTIREYERAYALWRRENGGSSVRDFFDQKMRDRFEREVAMEGDRRYNGKEGGTADPHITMANDILDRGYNLMNKDQKYVGTIGSARLPEGDTRGYRPRRMAVGVVANLTDAQRKAFVGAISQEFQVTAGFDKEFSDAFAVKYLERANRRAKGAYDVPGNLHSDDAADIVRDALTSLKMNEEQITTIMGRFSRGGASHTKSRIDADLTTLYPDGNGGNIMLLDLMNNDNLGNFRQYARRVSGEVTLAKYGIMGEQGLKELRTAMEVGPDGQRASSAELQAFDQIAAEFIGKPFGTHLGKWADNARSFTSALRLGGMGFNQFGEYGNAVAAIGVLRAAKSIGDVPRLFREVRAMKNGKPTPNTLLGSMELYGGEFGMDGYRMKGMYDVNDGYEVYGSENIGVFSKAIRAGAHANRVLSTHRAINAVQTRGMAEQIVMKSLKYIRDGIEDKALADMGITPEVAAAIKADLHLAAEFNGNDVLAFDVTKISNDAAAHAYMQAVHRGAGQIIQETFIGETGKWAHDGWLKLLTQFRTFGIVATQKQWRRQSYTHGTGKALGYLLGTMSIALPIHMARVQLKSIGHKDRDAYLDQQLSPMMLGRQTMNYASAIGLLPDILDIGASAAGASVTGGRAGNSSPFIGGQVLPAAGVANDIWKVIQTRDPHRAAKLVPGSNLPYLQAAVNQLDE
jgi:transglycosylase-like protein with SLT domain